MFIRKAPTPPLLRARIITIAPGRGRPSEPITVPEIRDRRAGTNANAMELNSWPRAAVTVWAWLTSATPG